MAKSPPHADEPIASRATSEETDGGAREAKNLFGPQLRRRKAGILRTNCRKATSPQHDRLEQGIA